ncbi:Glutamate-ammonia-ligase adenylyltransferase, partial [hydrothermal vent metagenome]
MPLFSKLTELQQEQSNILLSSLMQSDKIPAESLVKIKNSLVTVWSGSQFVEQKSQQHVELFVELVQSGHLWRAYETEELKKKILSSLRSIAIEADLMRMLRVIRTREMIRIIWRDLAGWSDLPETMRELSELADACVDSALTLLYRWGCEKLGTPFDKDGNQQHLVVLGMGKLGGHELNLSSDIDLIFAYPEEGETQAPKPITNHEFFQKIGQQLINVLSKLTADGFVFRVDMRLRPFGSGPLAISFDAMEDYYQIHGREWERYAMIKARVIAGDQEQGEQLLARLKPFVYRRYVDYSAFESIREMKAMIQKEVKRKNKELNIKVGAGGIREIEFIGQVFQL